MGPTYHDEYSHLHELYSKAVDQSRLLGLPVHDGAGRQVSLGELQAALRAHRERYGIAEGFSWETTDPDSWPFTPPLEVFAPLLDSGAVRIWEVPQGHVVNLLESAICALQDTGALAPPEPRT